MHSSAIACQSIFYVGSDWLLAGSALRWFLAFLAPWTAPRREWFGSHVGVLPSACGAV